MERLTHQKYDAVEMFGEPHKLDLRSVNETFRSFGIPVCGITGMWGPISEEALKRRILTSNKEVLAYSQDQLKSRLIHKSDCPDEIETI